MSLKNQFIQSFDEIIRNFSKCIAEKFKLDGDEVYGLWDTETKSTTKPVKKPSLDSVDTDDISVERLMKATKPELAALCKARCIKASGKKEELIERLMEISKKREGSSKAESSKAENKAEKKAETKTSRDFRNSKKTTSEVVQKTASSTEEFVVKRSSFHNYIHPATKLVFDPNTKTVVGKEEDDGTVSELNDEDVENCKKYKFPYKIPENLDSKVTIDNVQVDELEESDIENHVNNDDDEDEVVELEEDDE